MKKTLRGSQCKIFIKSRASKRGVKGNTKKKVMKRDRTEDDTEVQEVKLKFKE